MKTLRLKDGSIVSHDGLTASIKTTDGQVYCLDHAIHQALQTGVMDADAGFFFQRQLELIKSRSYDVKYAELKARSVFPVNNEGGAGISHITYRTYDQVGAAQIINAYANDLPRADVSSKETSFPVRSVGTSFGYNIDEIAASEMTGAGLDQRRANAAGRSVEQVVNDIAFKGDAQSGLGGLFDNANIPTGNVVDPGSGTQWVNKTPDQILFDINDLFTDIFEATKMVERGNTLLLPPRQWSYIMSTPRSANSDTTIAQYVVTNSPYLSSLDDLVPLNECESTFNTSLSSDVMVAYDLNPERLELHVPLELEMLPVQQKNLEFVIPARARVGGLAIYYPMSLAIGEGI